MLKSYKVERLVVSAIPSSVDTWTSGFGFKPVEDEEKESLRNINFMTFPGTVLLGKLLYKQEVVGVREDQELQGVLKAGNLGIVLNQILNDMSLVDYIRHWLFFVGARNVT